MLTLLVYLSISICFGHSGIISGPENQILASGDVATFNCHARGDSVHWLVDDRNPQRNEAEYNERGFNFSFQFLRRQNGLDEYNNTIQVKANPSNNSTRILCIVYIYRQPEITQEGTLIIAGPPLVPILDYNQNMLLINNSIVHTLSWDSPFTWPNFPTTSYTINITNYFDEVANLTTIYSNDSHIVHQFSSHGDRCYDIQIVVIAINSIGDSEPAVLSVGHPIIMENIEEIETTVTFTSTGIPHFWMSFVIPNICPGYQTGIYNVTVYAFERQILHYLGPTQFMAVQENDNSIIVKEIKSGFVRNQNYSVEVSMESVGISNSRKKMFNTRFAGCHDEREDYETGSVGATITKTSESCAIASSTVGGFLLMIILFLALVALIKIILRQSVKKKSFRTESDVMEHQRTNVCRSIPTSLKIQASNPIYEGAIYETTPGESVKSLLDSAISPNTPSAEQNCRYTFDLVPKLPAPRKTSKRESCESSHDLSLASLKPAELSAESDEYMAMTIQ